MSANITTDEVRALAPARGTVIGEYIIAIGCLCFVTFIVLQLGRHEPLPGFLTLPLMLGAGNLGKAVADHKTRRAVMKLLRKHILPDAGGETGGADSRRTEQASR